jgi:capsid protein
METGQLFPVDADRLATPQKYTSDTSVHQGVKASKRGIVEGYFVCNYKPNGMVNKDSFEFYPRENFIHVVWPWRIASQWRGVPELAAIMNKLQDIKSADKYQLLKIKNDAMQFLKHTREGGGGFANASPRNFTRREDSAGGQTVVERHDWGMKWTLSQGEDIQAFESKSPNSQYVPYLEYQARTIGAALGLPFEFVMMLFTNGSFSAQRSALLHAMHKFILWHSELSTMFCARVWNWRIAKAMKEGVLPFAPIGKNGFSEWFKCAWSLPETGWVDPEAFIEAERKAWSFGKTSLKKIASSQGQDREEMLTEKGRDIIEAAKVAEQVNKDMPGLNLSWRDIINPDLGSGQPAPASNDEQPPAKTKQETAKNETA